MSVHLVLGGCSRDQPSTSASKRVARNDSDKQGVNMSNATRTDDPAMDPSADSAEDESDELFSGINRASPNYGSNGTLFSFFTRIFR